MTTIKGSELDTVDALNSSALVTITQDDSEGNLKTFKTTVAEFIKLVPKSNAGITKQLGWGCSFDSTAADDQTLPTAHGLMGENTYYWKQTVTTAISGNMDIAIYPYAFELDMTPLDVDGNVVNYNTHITCVKDTADSSMVYTVWLFMSTAATESINLLNPSFGTTPITDHIGGTLHVWY